MSSLDDNGNQVTSTQIVVSLPTTPTPTLSLFSPSPPTPSNVTEVRAAPPATDPPRRRPVGRGTPATLPQQIRTQPPDQKDQCVLSHQKRLEAALLRGGRGLERGETSPVSPASPPCSGDGVGLGGTGGVDAGGVSGIVPCGGAPEPPYLQEARPVPDRGGIGQYYPLTQQPQQQEGTQEDGGESGDEDGYGALKDSQNQEEADCNSSDSELSEGEGGRFPLSPGGGRAHSVRGTRVPEEQCLVKQRSQEESEQEERRRRDLLGPSSGGVVSASRPRGFHTHRPHHLSESSSTGGGPRYILQTQRSVTGPPRGFKFTPTGSRAVSFDGLSNGAPSGSCAIPGRAAFRKQGSTTSARLPRQSSVGQSSTGSAGGGGSPYTRWDSGRCSIEFHFPTASNSQEAEAEMEVDSGSVLAFAGGGSRSPRTHSAATYRRGCQTSRRRRHFRPDCVGLQGTWSVIPAWLATAFVLTAALGHLLSFSLPMWARGRQNQPGRPLNEGAGGWRGECSFKAGLQADLGDARYTVTYSPPEPQQPYFTPKPQEPTEPSINPIRHTPNPQTPTPQRTDSMSPSLSSSSYTQAPILGSSSNDWPPESSTWDQVSGSFTRRSYSEQQEQEEVTTEVINIKHISHSKEANFTSQLLSQKVNISMSPKTETSTEQFLDIKDQKQPFNLDPNWQGQTNNDLDLEDTGLDQKVKQGSNRTRRSSLAPRPLNHTMGILLRTKVTPGSRLRSSTRTSTRLESKVGEYVTVGLWNICRADTCWMWCMDRLPGWFRLVQAFTTLGLIFCLMTSSLAVCQIAMPHCKDKYLATGGAAIILLLGETFAAVAVSVFGARLHHDEDLTEVTLHTSWSFYIAVLSIVAGVLGVVFLFWDTRLAQLDKTAYFDIDQEDAEEEQLRLS